MRILLSNSSKEPFYNQIYEQIKSFILSDELKDGENLPSMRKLAHDLGVSVITVKRAYDELEKESFIYSIVGKGSFVSENNIALIKEKKMQAVEEQLQAVVSNSKEIGISLEELQEMLKIFYRE
ncbi:MULTISPECIES: GntR family transcriptional regulator [Bacillales]|uniref:GntR family transcriptional regulator n=2 Tax=Bacillales TaxID=1385 RepID=A0A0M2SLY3_9STAP|nr:MULTISPECIES: GntR family transcriptional regulator [Salinicoccus]KKK34671.1 GntR family transcriptional regulator [Salinicoccus sediminis]SDL01957.1 transcriptional regulator, GntR family [Salinicoccus qingdaonensis]